MKLYLCDPDKNTACPARNNEARGCGTDCRHTLHPEYAVAGSAPKEIATGLIIGAIEPKKEETKCKK